MSTIQAVKENASGRKVVIQKADLDTALTALLLDVSHHDEIVVVRDKASSEDLTDPAVICIECGGSGQTELSNFDHHDTAEELQTACEQAFWNVLCADQLSYRNQAIDVLVDYVATLDAQGPEALKRRSQLSKDTFPTLSDVFSGMLLITRDPKDQLLKGIAILDAVLEQKIDPFGLMPELPEWHGYIEAKRQNHEAIQHALKNARFFRTQSGHKAGFVTTDIIGALGALYKQGCEVVIAYSPRFGNPPVPKYTIAGNGVRVDSLLTVLNGQDPGWGGPAHGTIVGSPREGSQLKLEKIVEIVQDHL